jgi:hypothetical protein
MNNKYDFNIKIDEHRAPTDASIAICNEIREKTIKSIIDSGADQFDVNEIYWVVFDSPETRGMRLSLSFYVDGSKVQEILDIPYIKLRACNTQESLKKLQSIVGEFIVSIVSQKIEKNLIQMNAGKLANILEKL